MGTVWLWGSFQEASSLTACRGKAWRIPGGSLGSMVTWAPRTGEPPCTPACSPAVKLQLQHGQAWRAVRVQVSPPLQE